MDSALRGRATSCNGGDQGARSIAANAQRPVGLSHPHDTQDFAKNLTFLTVTKCWSIRYDWRIPIRIRSGQKIVRDRPDPDRRFHLKYRRSDVRSQMAFHEPCILVCRIQSLWQIAAAKESCAQ